MPVFLPNGTSGPHGELRAGTTSDLQGCGRALAQLRALARASGGCARVGIAHLSRMSVVPKLDAIVVNSRPLPIGGSAMTRSRRRKLQRTRASSATREVLKRVPLGAAIFIGLPAAQAQEQEPAESG